MPSVLLVVGGGEGTLKAVVEALKKNSPLSVVVIVGSGRAADLLAYVYKRAVKNESIYKDDSELSEKVTRLFPEFKDNKQKQTIICEAALDFMKKKDYVSKHKTKLYFLLLKYFPHTFQF